MCDRVYTPFGRLRTAYVSVCTGGPLFGIFEIDQRVFSFFQEQKKVNFVSDFVSVLFSNTWRNFLVAQTTNKQQILLVISLTKKAKVLREIYLEKFIFTHTHTRQSPKKTPFNVVKFFTRGDIMAENYGYHYSCTY